MFRLLPLLLLMTLASLSYCLAAPEKGKGKSKAKLIWTEYEANFTCQEGRQPVVTIKWFAMDTAGAYQEYPEIWRKGMKFGYGERLRVESLSGVDHDGNQKKGQIVVATILDTKTGQRILFRSDHQSFTHASYSAEWMQQRILKTGEKEAKKP